METSSNKTEKKSGNKLFVILSGILLLLSGFLGWQLYRQRYNTQVVIVEKEHIKAEYNNVKDELEVVQKAYDGLQTNNKELQAQLDAKKSELEDLSKKLEKHKNDAAMVVKLKKEVLTVKGLIKYYLRNIDSLNTMNKGLIEENERIKSDLTAEQTRNQELTSENKNLVTVGSKLKAYKLWADAVKVKEQNESPTTKANRADKVRACFALGENKIAQGGDKIIYMKIIAPDGQVLSNNSDNVFTINGEKQLYSSKKEILYDNSEMEVCIYYSKAEGFKPGRYNLELFVDGSQIGSTFFELN